ncbi:TPA: PTS glucose transporter subunit IIA [Clostridioides difficile]|uniref:PTS system transporter subunit IIABC n=1 Tax=Clostridioides difficile ATCC 9689 = DSM 1296 TaxID=1121308 RepID=A0AC59G304_CLODI|nr:beta-glucoside-specific PTS transporter subunit IIABC [Clostridioides difficile]OFU28348.1 PTS beta-glucoside transporter subunit IIABC [Clostridium sp. HMSC19B12]AKP44039.1 PTS system transporter subunit IIABC [Clostridioides difficile ATCC 9689 = DSM 1296]ARC15801.1 PTS beta-glucoside transporter subunit EIIBCA [Clostridioides difficile]AVI13575.1 PTS beta-glucoside transporter subunit EIIBCA [Clostridioides difficile]AXU88070.1 PTS system transporter subunit IIABC [Clostridioides diffici
MGKYKQLAQEIVNNVGGKENISGLVHCITRLRFTLKDESIANDNVLKNMEGIVTVMKSGGQYQVVIGNHVEAVYKDVVEIIGLDDSSTSSETKKSGNILDKGIDIISGIFQPVLGIMAACGMLKGFNALFVAMGLYSDVSGGYMVINAAGDALFTFLPLFLGYTSAKKFGLKPMLGLALGAAVCYPAIQGSSISVGADVMYTLFKGTMFASPVYIDFFGLPIVSIDYTGTVVPIIFIVYFASRCEKLFNKCVPDLVKFFFVPMLTLLITVPVALIVIGPIATFGSTLISQIVISIRDFSPLLAGAIVGFTWQILVIFGMHWGFIPVYINNVMTLGYDNVMMPFFACTFASSAVVLAIFFKTKDKKLKEMAIPNFISGIFGVTEPAIYGILLPLKKPFIISCIASGIGGAFYGFFNLRKFITGGMGIFELPAMIEPDGGMGNLIVALSGIAISMVVAFVLTMILYKDEKVEESKKVRNKGKEEIKEVKSTKLEREIVTSPIKGEVLKLSDIEDAAFASGVLGQGVAIIPSDGKVVAPVDGVVTTLFPSLHAIGILSDTGVEVLIHIGLNTIQLEGRGFEACIKQGDRITKGQTILNFDVDAIKELGYSTVTPIVITNSSQFLDVVETESKNIELEDNLITVLF